MNIKQVEYGDKLIVVVLPVGKGSIVINKLNRKGFNRVNLSTARGVGAYFKKTQIFDQNQRDIVYCLVKTELADDLFKEIYFDVHIHDAPGGFIYMMDVSQSSLFELPMAIDISKGGRS